MLVRESLVATLMQCLVMSQELAEIDVSYTRLRFLDGSNEVEMRAEEDCDYYGLLASITIERTDRPTDTYRLAFANESPQNFPVILTKALALTQQTIFRRRPRVFPGLIYCVCLMSLIAQPLRPMVEFISSTIEAGDTFYDILYTVRMVHILLHKYPSAYRQCRSFSVC